MRHVLKSQGFTLLEVLIALLIFSLGVLGMAGILVISVRTNQSAYERSQASFLAQSVADRMRANSALALWNNLYNGSWSAPASGSSTCQSSACNYDAIATRDIGVWTSQVARFLPNSSEAINCSRASGTIVPTSSYQWLPPYDGLCTITLTWSESTLERGSTPNQQTFAWVFQP